MLRSIAVWSLSFFLVFCDSPSLSYEDKFAKLDSDWLVTPPEAHAWASRTTTSQP